jgi:hypothetical protein
MLVVSWEPVLYRKASLLSENIGEGYSRSRKGVHKCRLVEPLEEMKNDQVSNRAGYQL